MLKDILRETVGIATGKQFVEIADILNSKKYVNEFLIAKKLDITINQTRNLLYKLSDHGLVSSIRKKDKKKGWYTYFWKIEILKSLEFLKSILLKRVNELQKQINSRETRQFYFCERCNIEFNEETALLYDFTCNECGDVFNLRDNSKVLREFKKSLTKINNELIVINEEIEKEMTNLEKVKAREIKKTEKKKIVKKSIKKIVKEKKIISKVKIPKKPIKSKIKAKTKKKVIKKIIKKSKTIKGKNKNVKYKPSISKKIPKSKTKKPKKR